MKDWWIRRNPRERLVLQVAAIVVALLLAWSFILEPLSARQSALQARIAAQEKTLQQLFEARALLDAGSRPQPGKAEFGDRSMASVIEQGLRMAGLAASIRRIEPAGDDSVSLVLEQAAFDPLVRWLQKARDDSGIAVRELSIENTDTPGAVNARMRLAKNP